MGTVVKTDLFLLFKNNSATRGSSQNVISLAGERESNSWRTPPVTAPSYDEQPHQKKIKMFVDNFGNTFIIIAVLVSCAYDIRH